MGIISDAIKKRLTPAAPDFQQNRGNVSPTPMLGEAKDVGLPKAPDFMRQKQSAVPVPPTHKTPVLADMADKSGLTQMPEHPIKQTKDVYTRVKEDGEDPYEALLSSVYKDREAELRRSKKAALLGDLAQLFGQSVSLAAGARQFSPITSDTSRFSNALRNLKSAYNRQAMDYTLGRLKALRDAKQKEANEDYKLRKELMLKEVDNQYDLGLIDAKSAARQKEKILGIEGQMALRRYMDGQEWKRMIYREGKKDKRNDVNAEVRRENGSGSKGGGTTVLTNPDGTISMFSYTPQQETALVSLYKKFRDEVDKDPSKLPPETLRYLKRNKGLGNVKDIMTVLNQNLRYYPAMTEEYLQIIDPKGHPQGLYLEGFGEEEEDTPQQTSNRRPANWY